MANLTLSDRPPGRGFPLAWDNVLYESPSLGYVVATHQQERDRGPTVFTYYYPLCDADSRAARARLLGLDWQQCADVVLTDLARAHPDIRTLVERLDVMRWGHAMIRPRPGFVWGGARTVAARPFRGVHFANTDLSGVALLRKHSIKESPCCGGGAGSARTAIRFAATEARRTPTLAPFDRRWLFSGIPGRDLGVSLATASTPRSEGLEREDAEPRRLGADPDDQRVYSQGAGHFMRLGSAASAPSLSLK